MNFDYLSKLEHFNTLYDCCSVAEELVYSYPDSSAIKSLNGLDYIVKFVINAKTGSIPLKYDLYELLNSKEFTSFINNNENMASLHFIRKVGTMATRNEKVDKNMALIALENLYNFVGECLKKLTIIDSYPEFDKTQLKKVNADVKNNNFSTNVDSLEFNLYKNSIPKDSVLSYKPSLTEKETRKVYIDVELEAVGWKVCQKENVPVSGEAGIEIRVDGMPNNKEEGFCDYVLYDTDCKPLAIVEAKKTSINPIKGRQQVVLYGECMKKVWGYTPVLYYTNGYEIKVIDQLGYPDRTVLGFMSLKELKLMIQRQSMNRTITDFSFNMDIANRPYQRVALTKILEVFNAKRRKALLVLATGTGKTRTAISLTEILTRHDWIKNVLFLADRTSLVSQAFYNFQKLLPNMSMCVISDKTISKEIDYDARVTFSTYQTIINMINGEHKKFGVGRFDLIIIDEAHRSIFNKYGAIFDYFDSLLVGLTATPRDDVKNDASTYDIFDLPNGEPTYSYDLEQAVQERYLVAYRCFDRTTELLKRGARYNDLSDADKKKYEEAFAVLGETPEQIKGSDFFKRIYNNKTCDLVLQTLMNEGLKIKNGDVIGKTIIFAYNHKHAELIVERFRKLYPEYGENFCQLIDNYVNYSDSLVKQFSNGGLPQIAVSVDMLDTGIDAPDVLNLVFFKEVYSKIKFVQMIGRGTRLCENLNVVSPCREYFDNTSADDTVRNYKDKQGFYIFDFCDNFEFFELHPDGRTAKGSLSLSQRLFDIRLTLTHDMNNLVHLSNSYINDYYNSILDELCNAVSGLNRELLAVKTNLPYVDKYKDRTAWQALSIKSINEIKKYILPLIISFGGSQDKAKVLDYHAYNYERKLLNDEVKADNSKHFIMTCAEYLINHKAGIDEVLKNKSLLLNIIDDKFWNKMTVEKLEDLRIKFRNLMAYIEVDPRYDISLDISDEVINKGERAFTATGVKTYERRVMEYLKAHSESPVIKKIKNFEKLTNEDINQLEDILWNELGTKEDYLEVTHQDLPAYVRKVVDLDIESANQKLSEYFSMDSLTSEQQEFIRQIILYVKQNGDITPEEIQMNEPFSDMDIVEIFGDNIDILAKVIDVMHYSIVA